MVWDTTAYQYTIHAIGAVESGMNYGAVNTSDAITIGLIQWYGTRAANLLNQMKAASPTQWAALPSSLTSDVDSHPVTDGNFWTNRYLDQTEINALHAFLILPANVDAQIAQMQADLENSYLVAAAHTGIDKDATPETAAFYCEIYNRNPLAANRIVGNCGPDSNLDRIYAATLNDSSESGYRTRHTTAYNIIKAHDTTGVGVPPDPGDGGDGTPGGDNGNTPPTGNASYITRRGSQLILVNKDKTNQIFEATGSDTWLAHFDATNGGVVVPPPTGTGGGSPPTGAIAEIIAWELTVIGAYRYSQGAGRLNPPVTGYSDCSGLQWYAYKTYAHIDVGNWTGEMKNHGTLVTNDKNVAKDGHTVIAGDLVLFKWSSGDPRDFDHVELYTADADHNLLSHGGPGNGPHLFTMASQVDSAFSIEVRRYI